MNNELVAKGYGIASMLRTSWENKLIKENSILIVQDETDLNSYWEIHRR